MKFENYNDWIICKVGKTEIVVNNDGTVDHMITNRGRTLIGTDAVERIKSDEKLSNALNEYIHARATAKSKWMENADHFSFYSDGGSLAVRFDGKTVLKFPTGGDGCHRLYIVQSVPPFFDSTGVSAENCTIEPLDYDCGGKPLTFLNVKWAWFYRCGGDIAIGIENRE